MHYLYNTINKLLLYLVPAEKIPFVVDCGSCWIQAQPKSSLVIKVRGKWYIQISNSNQFRQLIKVSLCVFVVNPNF